MLRLLLWMVLKLIIGVLKGRRTSLLSHTLYVKCVFNEVWLTSYCPSVPDLPPATVPLPPSPLLSSHQSSPSERSVSSDFLKSCSGQGTRDRFPEKTCRDAPEPCSASPGYLGASPRQSSPGRSRLSDASVPVLISKSWACGVSFAAQR